NTCTALATAADGMSGQSTGGEVRIGNSADSWAETFSKAVSFWWQATYSGDNNNTGPVKSACTSEPLVVNPNTPSVNTVLVPASPVSIGTAVHDASTLTAARAAADVTISYAIYTNNTCTTAATAADGISG